MEEKKMISFIVSPSKEVLQKLQKLNVEMKEYFDVNDKSKIYLLVKHIENLPRLEDVGIFKAHSKASGKIYFTLNALNFLIKNKLYSEGNKVRWNSLLLMFKNVSDIILITKGKDLKFSFLREKK